MERNSCFDIRENWLYGYLGFEPRGIWTRRLKTSTYEGLHAGRRIWAVHSPNNWGK